MVCPSDGTVSRRLRIHHRDHWRAYSTCRIRYDCLKIAEHELRRYHGVSRCSYGCTMTFPFWVFGEADCRPAFKTVCRPPQRWGACPRNLHNKIAYTSCRPSPGPCNKYILNTERKVFFFYLWLYFCVESLHLKLLFFSSWQTLQNIKNLSKHALKMQLRR